MGAARQGADVETLLEAAGIEPALLACPGWRGPVEAMARLVREIWAALDDEGMGYLSAPVPRGSLAFACELALEGEMVATGLARAARFYNLLIPDIETVLERGEEGLSVTVRFRRDDLDCHHYYSEFWTITWHRLACWLAGETIPMLLAEFDYRPGPEAAAEFRYMFPGHRIYGGTRRRILIDRHVLHAPVRRGMSELRAMLAEAPLDLMTIPASDASAQIRARAVLLRDPSQPVEDLAAELGLPVDSLRRRLRAEGQTLSTLRENVRRDKAVHWLVTSNRSVESIAFELGYSEARSFTRAFRQWTGTSPSAYRRAHVSANAGLG